MNNLSDRQKHQLQFLDDIYKISCTCSTKTYIYHRELDSMFNQICSMLNRFG